MSREMKVLPYNENWEEDYKQIKKLLINIFRELLIEIHHFGSTSIKGMSAKPIIDVMVIVYDIEKVDSLNPKMMGAGYKHKVANGIPGRRYFQYFHEDGVNHTQHIHVFQKDNPAVVDQLMFRDYLKIDSSSFEQYKQTKLKAAEMFRYSPTEYTNAKTDCINEIMTRARIYYMSK